VLGFDNHPGWKKGRVWASTYVERGPRDVYTPEQEDFQHEYAMCQLLLHGVTTALPIRSILYRAWAETYEEHARAAETATRLGIRMYLGPSYRTGLPMVHPDGSISLHWDIERGMRGLEEAIRFVWEIDGAHGGMIRGFLQPDRIEGCTDELLLATRDAARDLDCPVRLHCCQGDLEVRLVHERWGTSSLAVLRDLDMLGPRTLLPHGVYLGGIDPTPERIEEEIGLLAESGSVIVHCPLVMARHGDALRTFDRFRECGVRIGMGTDTWPPDFFLNLHVGIMTARVVSGGSMRANAADYYTAATIGAADALGRPDLGRLMPGALADIIVVDLANPALGQVFDPVQSLILAGSGSDVRTVIVDGKVVVREREIAGVDMEEMHHRARRQFSDLITSYPERAHLHPPPEDLFHPTFAIRHV
jgi:cytosine/adenosine deaminase-related metal-dependent hydrolase